MIVDILGPRYIGGVKLEDRGQTGHERAARAGQAWLDLPERELPHPAALPRSP